MANNGPTSLSVENLLAAPLRVGARDGGCDATGLRALPENNCTGSAADAVAGFDSGAVNADCASFCRLGRVGLHLLPKVGIEMPILERWLYGSRKPLPKNAFIAPLLAGLGAGALGLLLFYTFFLSRLPDWPVAAEAVLPVWKRFLACFYGAINEEVLARLFGFSLLLWLLRKIARQRTPQATPLLFWIANVIIAVLFVLAHLPSAKVIMPITPLLLIALFSINGLVSLMCGYLCWKRGLEAAMLAHFSTDVVVHVVGPMFFRG